MLYLCELKTWIKGSVSTALIIYLSLCLSCRTNKSALGSMWCGTAEELDLASSSWYSEWLQSFVTSLSCSQISLGVGMEAEAASVGTETVPSLVLWLIWLQVSSVFVPYVVEDHPGRCQCSLCLSVQLWLVTSYSLADHLQAQVYNWAQQLCAPSTFKAVGSQIGACNFY